MLIPLFADGTFADAISLAKQYGPFLLAVIFFLWRDYRREDRLSDRIEKLEDEQRNVLLPLCEKCTQVIAENTRVISDYMRTR